MLKKITEKEFGLILNDEISDFLAKKIKQAKPVYKTISNEERDGVILKIISVLLDDSIPFSGKHRIKQWEKGWGQNFLELKRKRSAEAITPHYFGKYDIQRFNRNFVKGQSPDYEKNMLDIILYYVFDKYLRKAENIYEFGCGTGFNLLKVREVNQSANLFGLDWTKSSQKIIKKMSDTGLIKNIKGYNFDFFKPDKKIRLEKNSAIYTVAALEQVGSNYKSFVSYLLKNRPDICLHVEPIAELLDENELIDNLSIKYFRKRNYLNGYLDHLKELEKEGKIKIHDAKRTYTGSMFIEGHSIIAWSPIK